VSTGKRVAIYARVSTDQQEVDLQLHDLREYVRSRDWEATEFLDKGVSGRKDSRPGLNAMMLEVRRKRFDVVLVWRFDRFARSTKHLVTALEEFRTLGVGFVSHQEALDTSTPMGACMFTICAAMATLECDLVRERTKAGMESARRAGKQIGGKKLDLDPGVVRAMHAESGTRGAARALGVSPGTILNVLRRGHGAKPAGEGATTGTVSA
jgi:DNA invertase Pin-like site-specific DNA recombinase